MPVETITLHAPEHIPNRCMDCRAPLMPRVRVWPNADRDEWACSERCSDGVYLDWSIEFLREIGALPDGE